MLSKKWILFENLIKISTFTCIIESDIGFCWAPKTLDELLDTDSLRLFYLYNQSNDIVISINKNITSQFNNEGNHNAFFEQLCRYFYHTSYKKIQNAPLLYCFDDLPDILYKKALGYFTKHGFENLHLISFDIAKVISSHAHLDLSKLNDVVVQLTLKNIANNKLKKIDLFLKFNTHHEIATTLLKLKKSEVDLLEINETYQLLVRVFNMDEKNSNLKFYLKKADAENNNSKIYLSHQQKSAREILDWYVKEYEALPLWYKRFGHIIKVIIGKRSLKTLFYNNVKK